MEISKQVISLELAKKLKEAGVKQKSIFYWEGNLGSVKYFLKYADYNNKKIGEDTFSAFIASEIGMMLPPNFVSALNDFNSWYCYSTSNTVITDKMCQEKTEAEARGSMLLHLLTNNLISLDDINKMK